MTRQSRCALVKPPAPCAPVVVAAAAVPPPFPTGIAAEQPGNCLLNVGQVRYEPLALSSENEWHSNFAGSMVRGASNLLGGTPGAFKSGLALQLMLDLGRQGVPQLLIGTEEPPHRAKERALLMTSNWPRADVERAFAHLHVESDLQDIEALPRFIATHVLSPAGRHHGVQMIALDSIQGHGLPSAATRKYERLYEAMRLCKSANISMLLISHVTKRGEIAGPKALEHNCDVVWLLRKTMSYRMLFVPKNRFGPCALKPLALELDPITVTLRPAPHAAAMTSVARTYFGNGIGAGEIQASVSLSNFGSRGKVMAPGLPRREIEQLVACLGGVEGFEIDELDFTLHCRLPGSRPYQPSLGLPLCMALVSSYIQRPIPSNQVQIGEIDLLRTVRDLPAVFVEQLAQAVEAGELNTPLRLLCPEPVAPHIPSGSGIEIVPCRQLDDAIFATWPELR